jgi:hypothetical protein
MMTRWTGLLAALALLMLTTVTVSTAWALDGPELPCENCPPFNNLMMYPSSGIWYNPDQPGTGFTLEVQDGMVAGYYFLYDEEGNPQWLMFTGPLEPGEVGGVRWRLDAELMRISGGACLHCPFQPFEDIEIVGELSLEFFWRNHGRFSVDGQAVQNIVPLFYAAPPIALFEPESDFRLPEPLNTVASFGRLFPPTWDRVPPSLATWAFVFRGQCSLGECFGMLPVLAGQRQINEEGDLVIELKANLGGNFIRNWGEMRCFSRTDVGPICRIEFNQSEQTAEQIPLWLLSSPFDVAAGNLGHNRLEAESADGRKSLIAFKMHYD